VLGWNELDDETPDDSQGPKADRQKPLERIETPLGDSDGFSCKCYENDLHEENGKQNGQKVRRLHNVLEDVESIIEDSGVDEVKDLEHDEGVKDVSHVD
jgi:hypothetical protein